MTWGPFDDRMPRHCKYAPLSAAAFRLAIHANLWSREMGTGGFVPRAMLPHLVSFGGRKLEKAIHELVHAGAPLHVSGIWRPADAAKDWWIHDFEEYGPGAERASEAGARPGARKEGRRLDPDLSRKRAEAGRLGGLESQRRRASGDPSVGWGGRVPVDDRPASAPPIPINLLGAEVTPAPSKTEATGNSDPDLDPDLDLNPDRKENPPTPQVEQNGTDEANGSSTIPATETSARRDGPAAQEELGARTSTSHRAQAFLRNSRAAELRWGPPQAWPELEALWGTFEAVWGRQDRPRQPHDSRVRAVIALYANGRTQDELERAIRVSKRYKIVAENPDFQRIKTILKDDEQVDNLLRLEGLAPIASRGRHHSRQVGGWQPPATEVGP